MLYALGCGLGADPLDPQQLRFVYEDGLKVLPSMAAVLGTPGSWWRLPGTGVAWQHVLHAQQDVRFLKPLSVQASVTGRNRVTHLHDRGPGRGAVAGLMREVVAEDGTVLARASRIEVLRQDGGFAAAGGPSDEPPPRLDPLPEACGVPDVEIDLATLPQAALIYRLSGDPNPLHADPAVARAAGFPRPILHGLGSFGFAAHAVLRGCCDYSTEALQRLAVRFVAPVFPGETLRFHLWRHDLRRVRFRAWALERGQLVLDNGLAEVT
jgi:acyl dehydratase